MAKIKHPCRAYPVVHPDRLPGIPCGKESVIYLKDLAMKTSLYMCAACFIAGGKSWFENAKL